MRRFRTPRGRSAAIALLPVVTAITIGTTAVTTATAAQQSTGLDASHNRVTPNETVTISGSFTRRQTAAEPTGGDRPASAAQGVRIQFRALGAKNWQDARRTKTGRRGKFSERIVVKRSGRFRAVSSDGRTTAPDLVTVKSRTAARISTKNAETGQKVKVKGHVSPAGAGRKVSVRIDDHTIHTKTGGSGSFAVKWKASDPGHYTIRARAAGNRIAAGSSTKVGKIDVFRPAVASYYGPGLYGNKLACGGTLEPSTIGVANKSMPCGTKLTLRYRGKEVDAKVIDRGPYSGDREFDLTEATKNKLGFGSTGTILVSK
jgi:rare lipoprotein A